MTKFLALTVLAASLLALPALADDSVGGVASDVGAVQKDNAAMAKSSAALAQDRAAKAKDKATGNIGGQAIDSLKVGTDKMGKSEKQSEKDTDKKVLNQDVNDAVNK